MDNLIGLKFNKLTVIKYIGIDKGNSKWLCQCECGKTKVVLGYNLKNGHTKSCGCLKDKNIGSCSKLYNIWNTMKQRCYDEKFIKYKNYGGRGIEICDVWLNDYKNFEKWALQNGYQNGLTIDRIDVNGNYEPSNCRWATRKVQANNKTTNHLITYNGETHTLAEWGEILGLKPSAILCRLKSGWSIERTLTETIKEYKKSKVMKVGDEMAFKIYKKIDNLGRVVFTAELRNALGVKCDEEICFECEGDKVTVTNPAHSASKEKLERFISTNDWSYDDVIEILKKWKKNN